MKSLPKKCESKFPWFQHCACVIKYYKTRQRSKFSREIISLATSSVKKTLIWRKIVNFPVKTVIAFSAQYSVGKWIIYSLSLKKISSNQLLCIFVNYSVEPLLSRNLWKIILRVKFHKFHTMRNFCINVFTK